MDPHNQLRMDENSVIGCLQLCRALKLNEKKETISDVKKENGFLRG